MSKARLFGLSACAAWCVLLGPAHAGRPLQTEDAAVLGAAEREVEGVSQRLRTATASARDHALTFNFGVGLNSQTGMTLSRATGDGESGRTLVVGGKTGLWTSQGERSGALTLAWGIAADRVDGSWQHSGRFGALVASLPAAPGTLHLNVSHDQDRVSERHTTGWNLAWEHAGVDASDVILQPMAEVFGNDRGEAWWNLALRATLVANRLFMDASFARQLRLDHARLLTIGFKFAF